MENQTDNHTNKQTDELHSIQNLFVKLVLSRNRSHSLCCWPVAPIWISTLILGSKTICTFLSLHLYSFSSPKMSMTCAKLKIESPLGLYEGKVSPTQIIPIFLPWIFFLLYFPALSIPNLLFISHSLYSKHFQLPLSMFPLIS